LLISESASTGVDEEPDQGHVTAIDQAPAFTVAEQREQLLVGEDRHGCFGHDRRVHARHRVGVDLVLVEEPPEPLLQGSVGDGDGGGFAAVGAGDDERLDVLAGDIARLQLGLGVGQVVKELLGCAPVDLERFVGEVAGA
jgi:hypothetical protein